MRRATRPVAALAVALLAALPGRAPAQERPRPTDHQPPPDNGLIGKSVTFDVPEGLTTPESLRFDKPFQQGVRCGPNGLYVLLRLSGRWVGYDDVLKRVPLTARGADLETLRRVGAEYGLSTEVRRLTPEELVAAPKPVLVHIETPASGGGKDPEQLGHFLVITKVRPGGELVGIDTTNALYSTWSPQFFARNATGYCLVPSGGTVAWLRSRWGLMLSAQFLLVVGLNLYLLFRPDRGGAPSHVGAPAHA